MWKSDAEDIIRPWSNGERLYRDVLTYSDRHALRINEIKI